jgi:hypothetical protein
MAAAITHPTDNSAFGSGEYGFIINNLLLDHTRRHKKTDNLNTSTLI